MSAQGFLRESSPLSAGDEPKTMYVPDSVVIGSKLDKKDEEMLKKTRRQYARANCILEIVGKMVLVLMLVSNSMTPGSEGVEEKVLKYLNVSLVIVANACFNLAHEFRKRSKRIRAILESNNIKCLPFFDDSLRRSQSQQSINATSL